MKYTEIKTKVAYEAPQWVALQFCSAEELLLASPYNDDGNEELDPDGEENW